MIIDGPVALDVETRGNTKDCRQATFILAAVAPQDVVTRSIPVIRPGAQVTVHNVPYDGVVCSVWDAEWQDTKMLAHLGGEPDSTLSGLAVKYLDHLQLGYERARDEGLLAHKCVDDVQVTRALEPLLRSSLRPETLRLYEELEQPLFALWTKMTLNGTFHVKYEELEEHAQAMREREVQLRLQVEDLLPKGRFARYCLVCHLDSEDKEKGQKCTAGNNHDWEDVFDPLKPVNIKSPGQLVPAINEAIGRHGRDRLRKVDKLALQNISGYPVARLLLIYRSVQKELSTYIEPWLAMPAGQPFGAIWHPTGAWTGRVSSSGPNLQNIPEELEQYLYGGPGYNLLTYDNKNLEIRMCAVLSHDELLLEVCRSTEDFHKTMQAQIGFKSKTRTKNWVFGTMYDGGPEALLQSAQAAGEEATWQDAVDAQATIKAKMPRWFEYMEEVRDLRVLRGMFGRWHHVPPHPDEEHRQKEAINCGPQGGGGDVTKYQMLALHRAGYDVVRQVHDSVTVKTRYRDTADAEIEVPRIMESAVDLEVPIKVERK